MRSLNLWLVLWLPVLLQAEAETPISVQPVGRLEVLVIYPEDSPQPSTQLFDSGLRGELQKKLGDEVEIYTEYLGLDRFPGPEHARNRASYLAARYRNHLPQLVIAAGAR